MLQLKTSRNLPPFLGGNVAIPIRPITGQCSLFPASSTRIPNNFPYGQLACAGRDTGLP